jgi:hypothetical protein
VYSNSYADKSERQPDSKVLENRLTIQTFTLRLGPDSSQLLMASICTGLLSPDLEYCSALPLWGLENTPPQSILMWADNPFLFRVWRKGISSVAFDQRGFVAHHFSKEADYSKSIDDYRQRHDISPLDMTLHVTRELDASPFVSTTLSLHWALANALQTRGSREAHGQDIYISAIRLSELKSEDLRVAFCEVLDIGSARNWADQSQEVLVFGHIPAPAILCTIKLDDLLAALPDWFEPTTVDILRPNRYGRKPKRAPCWDYAEEWASRFWNQDKETREQHAAQCVELAKGIVLPDVMSGFKTKDDVKLFALYLYRWPFRYPGCLDPMPSFDETKHIIDQFYDAFDTKESVFIFEALCSHFLTTHTFNSSPKFAVSDTDDEDLASQMKAASI